MKKIFIDGQHGAAGLTLFEKLAPLSQSGDISFVEINNTKDIQSRYDAIKSSDITVLCLPDEISKKTCDDLYDVETIIIDASRAHRTFDKWTYGFSDLNANQINDIKNSKRICNPGCFANGMLSILNPIKHTFKQNFPLFINGVTGYSAGGKKTIEQQKLNPVHYRLTSLNKIHDHVKEVKYYLNLQNDLMFSPSVSSFERGQMVSLTLFDKMINSDFQEIKNSFVNFYENNLFVELIIDNTKNIIPETMSGLDTIKIYISQTSENILQITAIYDNLGRGSSGSIYQIIKQLI